MLGKEMNKRMVATLLLMVISVGVFCSVLTGTIKNAKADTNQSNESFATYSIISTNTNAGLQYPTVADGYLWIVASKTSNVLEKCNLTTGAVIQKVAIPSLNTASTNEGFPAFFYGGLIFVGGISYQPTNTILTVFNETTLHVVLQLNASNSICAGLGMPIVYDYMDNLILFSTAIQNQEISFMAVDPTRALDASAYFYINIGPADEHGGWATDPAIFNDTVYIAYTNDGAGGYMTYTRVYKSNNLVDWTVVYSGVYAKDSDTYFCSFSANSNYISLGTLMSGNGDFGFAYCNKTSSTWTIFDSGVPCTSQQDHPEIWAIDNASEFVFEISTRYTSSYTSIYSPQFYLLNASSGVVTPLFSITNETGYNNGPYLGVDSADNCVYVPDCEITSSCTTSDIIKITFNFSISAKNLMAPSLTASCISSVYSSSLNVDIIGNLTYNGRGISDVPILLSYSVTAGKSWQDLTLVHTNSNGEYSASWFPSATGDYMLKAEYDGDQNYLGAVDVVNCTIVPGTAQSVFSVTSNSTLSAFSFDSSTKELSFSVSGEPGTTGYVNVYIPNSLLTDVSGLKVSLDGNEIAYTFQTQSGGWLLYFTYHHSIHDVLISLNSSSLSSDWVKIAILVFMGIVVTVVVIAVYSFLSKKSCI